ncbi:MAG TPA: hypothetical protein VF173_09765 [Thermoanaerobaculia bacterium]|nr:hypothetical protein [Thermoanaerobaculia bacterium]
MRLEKLEGLGILSMLLALWTGAAGAQQVTLPLTQYEDLRARANPAPETVGPPPAPFALEVAELAITAGPASARVMQTLRLTLYDDKWQAVPLGDPGSFIHADLAGVEGRVDASGKGWVLHVRGRGRHEVRLDSALGVSRDETATRPTWHFGLSLPPAAVVRGRIEAPAAVEEVEMNGAGQVSPMEGKGAGKAWSFVAVASGEAAWTLSGRATLPARAQLPLRWEATSATAAVLSRTRLRVLGWIEARVAQGRLTELRVPIPAGLEVASETGGAGWKMEGKTLVVTPLAPVEDSFAIELELTGEPRDAFATPLLLPVGSARTTLFAKAVLKGDGLLSLADPGSLRAAGNADAARLPVPLRTAEGKLYVVADAAKPPRWAAEWAERTEVLASQIDRLLLDVVVGEAGRASYQLWAEVRNRGAQQLTFAMPAGFELAASQRDGAAVTPGKAAGGGLSVPLLTQDAAQVVHLSGLLPLALPRDDGPLQVPVPSLSAPAARVEVRVSLPGGHSYKLADATRAGIISAPPGTAPRKPVAGMAKQVDAQVNSSLPYSPAPSSVAAFFVPPPGFSEIRAGWSALSATPAPLVLRAEAEKERPQWF